MTGKFNLLHKKVMGFNENMLFIKWTLEDCIYKILYIFKAQ